MSNNKLTNVLPEQVPAECRSGPNAPVGFRCRSIPAFSRNTSLRSDTWKRITGVHAPPEGDVPSVRFGIESVGGQPCATDVREAQERSPWQAQEHPAAGYRHEQTSFSFQGGHRVRPWVWQLTSLLDSPDGTVAR